MMRMVQSWSVLTQTALKSPPLAESMAFSNFVRIMIFSRYTALTQPSTTQMACHLQILTSFYFQEKLHQYSTIYLFNATKKILKTSPVMTLLLSPYLYHVLALRADKRSIPTHILTLHIQEWYGIRTIFVNIKIKQQKSSPTMSHFPLLQNLSH